MGKGVKGKTSNARLRKSQKEIYGESIIMIGGAENVSYEEIVNGHKVIRNKTIFKKEKKIVKNRGSQKK